MFHTSTISSGAFRSGVIDAFNRHHLILPTFSRIRFLSFCLMLSAILSLTPGVSAERSVSFTLRESPVTGIDIGDWNDSRVNESSGILMEAEYSLYNSIPQRNILSYFNSTSSINAMTRMEVFGFGAQLLYGPFKYGGKVPYIVMSADYRNTSGVLVGTAGPSKIVFDIAESDNGWNLNAVGLEVVNYDKYRNFINSQATGTLRINGHEVHAPENSSPEEVRVDLSNDGPISQITIETDEHASVGFRTITLYLADKAEFVAYDDPRAATPDYNPQGIYQLPYTAVGAVRDPEVLSCAIFDSTGKQMNVNASLDTSTEYFIVRPSEENGDTMEEGYYRAVYYLEDNSYVPKAEDGAEFAILPTANGMYLNWKPVDVYSSDLCLIPSHTTREDENGNTIQYDWEHVLINGFRPGTIVYWKVSGEPVSNIASAPQTTKSDKSALTSVGPSSEIPEGYQRLRNQSADLSKGNQLSLILQRNGVTSYPFNINYTKVDIPTSISDLHPEDLDVLSTEYYDMTGRRIHEDGIQNGQILLKIDRFSDGSLRTSKLFPRY